MAKAIALITSSKQALRNRIRQLTRRTTSLASFGYMVNLSLQNQLCSLNAAIIYGKAWTAALRGAARR